MFGMHLFGVIDLHDKPKLIMMSEELWLHQAKVKIKDVGTFVAERSNRRNVPAVATLRSDRSVDIELSELRNQIRRVADLKVMIMADNDGEARIAIPSNFEFKVPKAKTYRHVMKPEEREILKTLNRSFNLRSAG